MPYLSYTLRLEGSASTDFPLYVNYTESYNVATNQSAIKITSFESPNLGGMLYGSVYINGTKAVSVGSNISGTLYVSATAVNVSHNADGSGSFSISFGQWKSGYTDNLYIYYNAKKYISTTKSRSVSLTKQARGSTIASSPASANTLDTYQLVMKRNSESFYHKAKFSTGGTELATSEAFGASLSYQIPREWFDAYPESTTLGVNVSVQTYTDASCKTAVGSAVETAFTLYADDGMKPEVAEGWVSLQPLNTGNAAAISGYIQGVSKAQASFDNAKITLLNGATLFGYELKMGSSVDRVAPYQTDVISGTVVITASVVDSRGRRTSQDFTVEAMPYNPPSISEVSVFRCTQDGTRDDEGTFYSVKAKLYYSELNGQNSAQMVVQKSTASASYGTEGTLESDTAQVFGDVSIDTSYKIRIRATDALGNVTDFVQTLPSRAWAMKFRPTGNGVAFGKAAERDKALELPSDWSIYLGETDLVQMIVDKVTKEIHDKDYPIGKTVIFFEPIDPGTLYGGTWEAVENVVILGASSQHPIGETGGEETVTLTIDEMPAHSHKMSNRSGASAGSYWNAPPLSNNSGSAHTADEGSVIYSTGGGQPHNNMMPYTTAYVWRRIA